MALMGRYGELYAVSAVIRICIRRLVLFGGQWQMKNEKPWFFVNLGAKTNCYAVFIIDLSV